MMDNGYKTPKRKWQEKYQWTEDLLSTWDEKYNALLEMNVLTLLYVMKCQNRVKGIQMYF